MAKNVFERRSDRFGTKKWLAQESGQSESRSCLIVGIWRLESRRHGTPLKCKKFFERWSEGLTPAQKYCLDGFDAETITVYEFHGCWYHGCKRCFPQTRDITGYCHADRTVHEVYEVTLRKTQMLSAAGYTVVEKWECEYQKDKKTNADLKAFLSQYEAVLPLEPRDAFFGGQTGATTLYAKAEPGEEILTSLYPWVNKYCEYPVGFPVV